MKKKIEYDSDNNYRRDTKLGDNKMNLMHYGYYTEKKDKGILCPICAPVKPATTANVVTILSLPP